VKFVVRNVPDGCATGVIYARIHSSHTTKELLRLYIPSCSNRFDEPDNQVREEFIKRTIEILTALDATAAACP
jgi:hypothetical protein